MINITEFMEIAIDEAKTGLREGNHGFGAVIVRNDKIVARAHDLEESDCDPVSHAEMNAIRLASRILGKDLGGCILISTHEPCPMCAAAVVWAGISRVAFGCPIRDSVKQGRKRIDLSCEEVFNKAGKRILIDRNVLYERCSVLYRQDVRNEIKKLRNITDDKLRLYNEDSIKRRCDWFDKNRESFSFIGDDLLESAYSLLLYRFGATRPEMPVVERSNDRIIFHSKNFCPTLEACKILDCDTRYICRKYNENSTDMLVKKIDNRLEFRRNYEKIRPYSGYCEEMIILNDDK